MRAFKPIMYTNNNDKEIVIKDTYRELKKQLKFRINQSLTGQVEIYRSKRGQWGEYFEHWAMFNGKPKIVKEGWQ